MRVPLNIRLTIYMLERNMAEDSEACQVCGRVGWLVGVVPSFWRVQTLRNVRNHSSYDHSVTSRKIWILINTTLTFRDHVRSFAVKRRGPRHHLRYVSSLTMLYMLIITCDVERSFFRIPVRVATSHCVCVCLLEFCPSALPRLMEQERLATIFTAR